MISFKRLVLLILPPILVDLLLNRPSSPKNTFRGVYRNFKDIPDVTPYNNKISMDGDISRLRNRLKRVNPRLSWEYSPISTIRSQITNQLPLLLSLLDGPITLLDYGGGAGDTFLDVLDCIGDQERAIKYRIFDLKEQIDAGRNIFRETPFDIQFIDTIDVLDKVDIAYLGSCLQYVENYRDELIKIINLKPEFIFFCDNFFSKTTFCTRQVNMPGRIMAYWIFSKQEIHDLLANYGYKMIYQSANWQPFHNFNNFDMKYRVRDSMNLLFRRK